MESTKYQSNSKSTLPSQGKVKLRNDPPGKTVNIQNMSVDNTTAAADSEIISAAGSKSFDQKEPMPPFEIMFENSKNLSLSASSSSASHPQRHALIICDVQQVAMNAFSETKRRALLDFWKLLIKAAETDPKSYKIVYSGLQFSKDYHEIPVHHKLYGAFKRLYEKTKVANWFVEDQPGTQIMLPIPLTSKNNDNQNFSVVWRSQHMPNQAQLARELEGCTHATVVGIKTGHAVQSTVQAICDLGLIVSVIPECIIDDDVNRHEAVMQNLLPTFANIVPMADWMNQTMVGMDRVSELLDSSFILDPTVRYFCDCGRGGHAFLYMSHLEQIENTPWSRYPLQPWYNDHSNKAYYCPLGKPVLDFCDEPQFSKYSMFIKGREWLDEKDKLWELVPDIMPTTYLVKGQQWVGGSKEPESYDEEGECIFVKECDKNGGRAVKVCGSFSDALAQCEPSSKYVVQSHIPNPLLTNEGKKCHVKAYFLLKEHGGEWILHMYPEAYLSKASVPWSSDDLSPEAQLTVQRHVRLFKREDCNEWRGWPLAYDAAKELVIQVVERAVKEKKLQSRLNCSLQFEIFCADVLLDTSSRAWLIECNFGCVLYDPTIGQPITTAGLMEYQRQYEMHGEAAVVNDRDMIAETVKYIFNTGGAAANQSTKWDVVATF